MLVRLAQHFDADVDLSLNGQTASAKSILGVMMLCAGYGAEVKVAAEGTDAEEAIHAITQLFESSFHEPRGAAAQPNNGGTILVADDETASREKIKSILGEKGYQVITVRTGVEAVAFLTANLGDIRAVILDMIMPDMDGITAMSAIRRMNADLPVLAISASEGGAPFFRDDAVTAFLKKPFDGAELLPALRALLDGGAEFPLVGELPVSGGQQVAERNTNTGGQS